MDCKLIQPKELSEALEVREKYSHEGMPIAGGQSLLVMLRNKLVAPKALIDLDGLKELQGIQQKPDGLCIGAMTTFYSLLSSPVIQGTIPVLAHAAAKVSSTPIRNLGTIGGNLCHNELGADLPPALLTLDAKAELRSLRGIRKVPLTEFFRDSFETVVAPDEILSHVEIPSLPNSASGIYLKHAISPEDIAIVGVAVVMVLSGSAEREVSEVRIGLGGVAPVPFRAVEAEAVLKGSALDEKSVREAGEIAASEAYPQTDSHATADYRREMIKVFVRRAIWQGLKQAGRDVNGKV